MKYRDGRGRYRKFGEKKRRNEVSKRVIIEHNYTNTGLCNGSDCTATNCSNFHFELGASVSRDGWREGRRLIELDILLKNLKYCRSCKLGPVPLTAYNVVGELQKGLGGYLYMVCQNPDCNFVNRVSYGKVHRMKTNGMPCFDVNTKLGTAMIDSLGGPVRVNNLLSTLNVKPICNRNLKKMEERAGEAIEAHSVHSTNQAALQAFEKEIEDIAHQESYEARKSMEGMLLDDLGVCPLPDESPNLRQLLQDTSVVEGDSDWTDVESDTEEGNDGPADNIQSYRPVTDDPFRTPETNGIPQSVRKKTKKHHIQDTGSSSRRCLVKKFPCKTRKGMSCAVDTAWQKKGFDSLTSHTFFMSKAKYEKKVVKSVVSHRTCGTCNWWRRNKPGQPVRPHKCVRNHTGSARLMESVSGERGVAELAAEGTPVEYIEGDGDNTLIARLKKNMNIDMKKS
ncbi:uncharacterized protein LOC123562513 isoform X1 [Mercenaria mercenaria]|uniref:uncharacterized protein LOC123562513 isoform X1 n=1 Tax=Mercenaria mercenaria TaxID=6596 RepID=UPI00234ECB38|nr:uncharacterized protein LOC123562513 isoform X1 [Mercenaria mercenaria]